MRIYNVCLKCARWNTYRTQKLRQKSPSAHHRTNLSSNIFATKAYIDNRKNSLNGNISFIGSHNMMNFGPLTAEICWWVWGTPANFNGFCVLASLLHRRRSSEVTKLCTMFGRLLRWYITYTFWGLFFVTEFLPAAKFTLRQSLASSYTGIHTYIHTYTVHTYIHTYILIHIAPKS